MINLPNFFTLVRLIMVPAIAAAALLDKNLAAALLFVLAASTDWLDGKLARRLSQVSDFGKLFDPFVDRVLIISILVIFIIKNSLPTSIVLVVIIRDTLVLFGAYRAKTQGRKIRITFLGKLSTALLMISVPLVLIGHPWGPWAFYFAALISIVSFGDYFLKMLSFSEQEVKEIS